MIEIILRRTLFVVTITIFCGVVFHAPLSVWLGTFFPTEQLLVKSWKEILIGVALIITVLQIHRHHLWRRLGDDWIVRLLVAYGILHLLLLPLFWQGIMPSIAGLMIDLRFIAFFVVLYCALHIYPGWRRPLLVGALMAAVISLLFVVLQVTILPHDILKYIGYDKYTTIAPYMTVDQNYDYVRVNGTLRGPNPLGAYGVIILAIALGLRTMAVARLRTLHRFAPLMVSVLAGMAAVAIWFSYSRSALVVGVAVIGCIFGAALWRHSPRKALIVAGTTIFMLAVLVISQWNTPVVQNILLHENANSSSAVSSNDEHVKSLELGWARMLLQPFGAGVGSTGSASLMGEKPIIIENQYLFVAHETGWIGLILFSWLFGLVLVRLYARRREYVAFGTFVSGIGLALIGILLPVWVDDTVSIVWWGFAAIALMSPRVKKKRSRHERSFKQKTT